MSAQLTDFRMSKRSGEEPLGVAVPTSLKRLGFRPDLYYKRTYILYNDCATEHFERRIIRDLIARHEGIGDGIDEDRGEIWRRAAEVIYKGNPGIAKAAGAKWAKGNDLPSRKTLLRYFGPHTIPVSVLYRSIPADEVAPWRMAVARTLTYIRVLPPLKRPRDPAPSETLMRCWEVIRRHPHYVESGNINHHCLDEVESGFGDHKEIVLPPDCIGDLKCRIEVADPSVETWDDSWKTFAFIFSSPAIFRDDRLFNSESPCYRQIWAKINEY